MRYCGQVEFIVRSAEEWRSMPEDVFEANLAEFEKQLRAYHAQHANWRSKQLRMVPWVMIA